MAQDGTALNGEAAALMRAPMAERVAITAFAPPWLIDLKATAAVMREHRERPPGKPLGRWLGDFLDQDTASGLLPAEEKLLLSAMNGEACVLESRAALLWAALDEWRDHMPEAPREETGFVEAVAKFTAAAPEAVQEVIIEATRHAIAELRLPAYWEPKSASEVERFALVQRAFLARLEAEAAPAKTIEQARKDERFFGLAIEVVIEALTPRPYEPLKLNHEWLNPLLRRDPLNLSAEMRAKIDAQPYLLRGFFDALFSEVRPTAASEDFLARLKEDPAVLREHFEVVFGRYEREQWRWVDHEDSDIRVRARFLRFLSLGGDDAAPVHERGLELHGAYIGEDLDLSGCVVPQPLLFSRCHFAGQLLLEDAVTKALNLRSSYAGSIAGEGMQNRGGVFLHEGFCAAAGVSFPYANIEGRLSCCGGTLRSRRGLGLDCTGTRISGDVDMSGCLGEGGVAFSAAKLNGQLSCIGSAFRNRNKDGSGVALDCSNVEIAGKTSLGGGCLAEGCVTFSGAKIGGLDCIGGSFRNRTDDGSGVALNAERAAINDAVWLAGGFRSEGQVQFRDAHIQGNFYVRDGRFENAAPSTGRGPSRTRRAAEALMLRGAKIDGALVLGPNGKNTDGRAEVLGSLDLRECHAHEVTDHPGSWPPKRVKIPERRALPAFIALDGFTYGRLNDNRNVRTRKRWLDRQPPEDLGVDFRPQPFEQLIRTYREMGRSGDARRIAKFKERRRYRARFIKLWHGWRDRPRLFRLRALSPLNFLAWPFVLAARVAYRSIASIFLALTWAVVAFGTAYWYGWGRLSLLLLAIWVAGGIFYGEVAVQGGFAPSNPIIYLNKDLEAKCGKNWTTCKGVPPELPAFSPFTYSLDNMLPVFDLGQKRDWKPIDQPGKPITIVVPTFGWVSGYDLPFGEIPDISIEEQPLGTGAVDTIVRTQALLSWGVLGLLIVMLLRLIKRD